jgi:membrane-associated phospholipid phosphatase
MSSRTKRVSGVVVAALSAAAVLFSAPASAGAGEVLRWSALATGAAAAAKTDPLTESRWFAILHLAIHDALNVVEPRYETYRRHAADGAGASADAAVAAAAHEVLSTLMPAAAAGFDRELAASLARVSDGDGERRGVEVGRAIARALLAERSGDGADRVVARDAGTRPGQYRPTPPDLTPAFMAQWGAVTPFALERPEQFRPAPPPAPGSAAAAAELERVRRIGGVVAGERNEEQTEIAKYWFENSTQGWNRIARVVAEGRALDPWQSARLLALVHVAMADGFIAGFEAKYHYDYWRPVTAIRASVDAEWMPHLWTPPVPDHPSTHTVLGAAAAAALADFFGTDYVSFAMTSGGEYPGITRRFWSFSQAAREKGASRVFAGIHFPEAVREGYLQGERVGAFACERLLKPLADRDAGAVASR